MLELKILGKPGIIRIDETKNFIAKGGEATVYSYHNDVFRIYHDKSKMVPLEKINELSVLKSKDHIILPKEIVTDKKNEIVGFTMNNIGNRTLPLMRLFNTGFWKKNNLNINKIIKIVEFMQETTIFVHKNECLIVDFNELNNLIDDTNFSLVYYIDTCAWKTRSYPPTAVTLFAKDYTKNIFDEYTDWYSFAILVFQLFTGTHPFRGSHPKYKGLPIKEETVKRMKENASVYDRGVTLNTAVRDISNIPSNYNIWFKDLFVSGKRCFPPGMAGVVTIIHVDKIISKDILITTFYREFDKEIIDYKSVLGKEIFYFDDSLIVDNKEYKDCKSIIFDCELTPYNVRVEKGFLTFKNLNTGQKEISNFKSEKFFIIDNELYNKYEDFVCHIKLNKTPVKLLISVNNQWNVMRYSSKIFDGVIYENILGKCWFFIPVYQKNWGVTIGIKELDDYKIIDCVMKKNILIVIGKNKNDLKKFIIKFNAKFNEYKSFSIKDNIDVINFVVLDNGIVVNAEEDKIEIFDSNFEKDKTKYVDGDIMNMSLINKGNDVMIIENKKISKITLKK